MTAGMLPVAGTGAVAFAALKSLMQLRAGLLKRTLAKTEASQIADGVEHALTEAGRTLRRLPPATETSESEDLAQSLGDLKEQLAALARMIARLFDEAGDAAPRVPAPISEPRTPQGAPYG